MTSLDIGELFARLWAKENSKLIAATEIHDRNSQWLKDISEEARSLFKKECIKEVNNTPNENSETVNSQGNETELNDSACSAILPPILLPKTPRETKAREARIQKIKSESTGRPSYATSRSGRAASRAATSRIKLISNEKNNKKMRRPTDTNGNKNNVSEYTSSIHTEDSAYTEDENETPISGGSLVHSTSANGAVGSTDNSDRTEAKMREPNETSDKSKSEEGTAVNTSEGMHFSNKNESHLNKIDNDEPTSKKRRSSSISKDTKIITKVESETVEKKLPEPEATNSDIEKEANFVAESPAVFQTLDYVESGMLTQVEEKQKIDENNEEIKESDVEMKVDDIQAELCIKEKSLEEIPMGNDQNTPEIIDPCNMDTANAKLENECPKSPAASLPKIRVLRSQSSTANVVDNEDEILVRRSTRNKKKPNVSPDSSATKKLKGTSPSAPEKSKKVLAVTENKSNATPNAMGTKSISLASLRYPGYPTNHKKNALHSAVKDGKNCSTSALIAAAKASSSKCNNIRKFTPQSPLKDVSTVSAALGKIGSGGQNHYSASGSSGSSTLNRIRSRIGNVRKSPIKSASKNMANIPNIRSFLPQKPAKVPKLTEDEIRTRKEEELNLKRIKADEAQRKKEEAAKARQEERRLQNEARQKRVHEARQAKEQQKIHERERTEKEAKERQEAITKARLQAEERRRHDQEEKRKAEIEQEKMRIEEDKERKRQEEVERRRLMQVEEEKKQREQEFQKQRQIAAAEQRKQEVIQMENAKKKEQIQNQMRARLDETYNKDSPTSNEQSYVSNPNSTFTKENKAITKVANATVTSYDITPARHELPPEELVDEDNYDIAGLRSDEDTDDEDAPRKVIPKWAQSTLFRTAIMKQAFNPPDLDKVFFVMNPTIDLAEIFKESEPKRRYFKRTSSAVWHKPPQSQGYRN